LGGGVIHLPAYRGAKGKVDYWLPVPYLAYRGDIVKMDEEGVRGELFHKQGIKLDFSLAGNVPVPKDNDSARAGMDELDPIGEAGPSLDIRLHTSGDRHLNREHQLWLSLPVRAAVSVGNPLVAYQGLVFSPYLKWIVRGQTSAGLVRSSLSLGPIFASKEYHDYFYRVAEADVAFGRDRYEPDAGYSGSRITWTLSLNSRKWFIGAFTRYDDLQGAAFVDSPLVEKEHYFAVGLAVSRIFLRSKEMAPHY
jgi:outer membrane scaffolding protein for murein synthesis (MipA/OmpV family)